MDNNKSVSLPADTPDWLLMDGWTSSNSPEPSGATSPPSPFAAGRMSTSLPSSPRENHRDTQTYFNLLDHPSPNYMDNYTLPPSTMMPPETAKRHPETLCSATCEPKKRIPRPPNAFMLFRSWLLKHGKVPPNVERRQQNLSRIAGRCWNMLNDDEKNVWRDQATKVLQSHQKRHPEYKFTPAPKGTGRAAKLKRATEDLGEEVVDDATRIQLLAEMCCPELKGRGVAPSRKRPASKGKKHEFPEDVDFRTLLLRSFTPSHSPSPTSSSQSSPASYASSPVPSISPSPAPSAGSSNSASPSSMSPPFLFPPYLYPGSPYNPTPSPVGGRPPSLHNYETPYITNDVTPAAANFQMSYAAAANIYPPAPGAYSFETPPFAFPGNLYPGVNAFLGLHHLQLPYTNGFPYQFLSASPLRTDEEHFDVRPEFMNTLSFDNLLPTTDYIVGISTGATDSEGGNVDEEAPAHLASEVESPSSVTPAATPASQ